MKNAIHPIHPKVIQRLNDLNEALNSIYLSGDFSYTLAVEGQIVASKNTHDDVIPTAWPEKDIEAEMAKQIAKKPVVMPDAPAKKK